MGMHKDLAGDTKCHMRLYCDMQEKQVQATTVPACGCKLVYPGGNNREPSGFRVF